MSKVPPLAVEYINTAFSAFHMKPDTILGP